MPITRLFPILAALRGGATINALAEQFGVNAKTIRRDLIELQQIGFDLRETVEDRGRKVWRVAKLHDKIKELLSQ